MQQRKKLLINVVAYPCCFGWSNHNIIMLILVLIHAMLHGFVVLFLALCRHCTIICDC